MPWGGGVGAHEWALNWWRHDIHVGGTQWTTMKTTNLSSDCIYHDYAIPISLSIVQL